MERHFLHYLQQFPGSFVLLSPSDAPETAVVFIHGFGGDPYGTWSDFHQLIDDHNATWWSGCDTYFYSYPSTARQVKISAMQLSEFLAAVYPKPKEELFIVDPAYMGVEIDGVLSACPLVPTYRRLILAGHSEG
jgi:hypothetical protein